ncbi:Fic family protein [Leifsonia sp. PS1209]|uniref:Fic family protein n=1 Tax=Leifsonia sp. PS1209 TaxID=2724914 RepID=UPI001FF858F7|nr:Fic family protein [Leifsonia sp. PS1209]
MTSWPAHGSETLPWRQTQRAGTRDDRMMTEVAATIPPHIAALSYEPSLDIVRDSERALLAAAVADTAAEGHSAALSRFMLRTESVASSKIERIEASAEDFARAIAGGRGNSSATSMVAASVALHTLVRDAGESGTITIDGMLAAHSALMEEDEYEARYAGRVRDMQNWIGGSDHSPRGALHVPPAPERIPELLEDLVSYLNRDDVPVLVQAAIAHAQFESIHPFTDGNGRIGRALISAVLWRRGVTANTVIPLASGILARKDDYFDALTTYRSGHPTDIIRIIATATRVAAVEARVSIGQLSLLPDEWHAEMDTRRGSAIFNLIPAFFDHPVMTSEDAERLSGSGESQTFKALDRLAGAGIIREITGRKRGRVWVAADLIAELDDLDRRIQAAMRRTRVA